MLKIIRQVGFIGALLGVVEASGKTEESSSFLVSSGKVQSFLTPYNDLEKVWIQNDKDNIQKLAFYEKNAEPIKRYVGTAGTSSLGKSILLQESVQKESSMVYIDANRFLRSMLWTYGEDTTLLKLFQDPNCLAKAHEKWLGASKYISNQLLNEGFAAGLSLAHSTTATSPDMENFYKTLKDGGYHITLLLCFIKEHALYKDEGTQSENIIVPTTSESPHKKQSLFMKNLPLYFKWADQIHLFYFDENLKQLVGTYTPQQGLTIQQTKGETGYEAITHLYEAHRQMDPSLASFNTLILPRKPGEKS